MIIKKFLGFLKNRTLKENYTPTLLGLFVNPFYLARNGLATEIKPLAKHMEGKVLDLGCGQKPYEKFCCAQKYVGIELDTPENRKFKKADLFYDGKSLPIENGEIDNVLSNQVLEHVFEPSDFLKEINRVLKINGHFLLTVPFVWDEHEQPYDYARYSSYGIQHLLKKHGFEIIELKKHLKISV